MTRNFKRILFPVLVFFLAAWLNWKCSSVTPSNDPHKRSTYAGLADTARYVGMETCKGCHANVHETFMHTGMGKSFDLANKAKSAAKFDQHALVYDASRDFYYHPFWEGDSLKFKEFRLSGKDTVYQRVETIRYIVGSGQHTNSHIWQSNGYLYQAPLTYYTQKGKWDLPPGFEHGNNTRFNRPIGNECITCHNAYPDPKAGTENGYNLVRNGIDCERCHGPGSIHVAEKSSGILIDTSLYIDYSIVNPAKLPIDLQFDVCQRCHIQGNAVLKEGKSFFDFKPGMHLSDVMDVYMPVYKGRDDQHIMASHAERLKLSRCFQETMHKLEKNGSTKALKPYKNALTCVTCHNPHISVKQTDPQVFVKVCQSCHTSQDQKLCKEDLTIRKTKSDNCVSCHMPFNGATDIPHVSVHDHRIQIVKNQIDTSGLREFIGVACINNAKPSGLSIAQAYINYVEKFGFDQALLDSAQVYLSKELSGKSVSVKMVQVQLMFLRKDFEKVASFVQKNASLSLDLNQLSGAQAAWTAYRIGESFAQTGDLVQAAEWYSTSVKILPGAAEFSNKLASTLVLLNRTQEAYSLLKKAVLEHPEYAPAWSNLGYLTLSLGGDYKYAGTCIDRALALDPDYESARLNKAAWFLAGSQMEAAKKVLEGVLRSNPESLAAKDALKRLNRM